MQVHDDFFLTHNNLFQGLRAPGQRIRWVFLEDSNGRSRASEAMHYLDSIGHYVKYYSGGQGHPLVVQACELLGFW